MRELTIQDTSAGLSYGKLKAWPKSNELARHF